jgi:hypothetical protein
MLKRCTKRFVCGWAILCLVSHAPLLSQDETNPAKKPALIVVRIQVIDRKTGSAIDNADVQVKWGQRESDSGSATTNSKGIARLTEIPQGKVVIAVIASGYKKVIPPFDLKKEEQPIKIELDKETHGHAGDNEAPPPE